MQGAEIADSERETELADVGRERPLTNLLRNPCGIELIILWEPGQQRNHRAVTATPGPSRLVCEIRFHGIYFGVWFRAWTVDLVALFGDLVRFETELWNRVDARIEQAHGVPLAWVEIMQVVRGTADCRVLDIARALSITVGGASKVVDRVEAAGLCRREPNPADGRSNLIRLTEPGKGMLAAADVTFADALAAYLGAVLPPGELAQLHATLRRLRQHRALSRPGRDGGG